MCAINGDKLIAGRQSAIYAGISSLGARILEIVLKGIRISCHCGCWVDVARITPTIYPIGTEIPGGPELYQSKKHKSTLFLGGTALPTSFAKDFHRLSPVEYRTL